MTRTDIFKATKVILTYLIVCISTPCYAETPIVEIQIHNTNSLDDDYVTWAPSSARIRLHPTDSIREDLRVVLTNDVTEAEEGRNQPLDGDVSFAKTVSQGETATLAHLSLLLPSSGDWVPFVIAGRFPEGAKVGRSSSRDKDTVIEVHKDYLGGELIGDHRLMVRIRKNVLSLTDYEKTRLLSAIRALKDNGIYEKFVEVHDWAARGDRRHEGRINPPEYLYPDAAHRNSNFLAWHRVDLLQFERELQKIYPDVSIHYWQVDKGDPNSVVFSKDFFGSNEIDTTTDDPRDLPTLNRTPYLDFVKFSPSNPLFGWRIDYQGRFANPSILTRWPINRKFAPFIFSSQGTPGGEQLPGEKHFLRQPFFEYFTDEFEVTTHNKGHHWFGPPMRDCTVAPIDPAFWIFHSWFDRVWARWQRKYDRFYADGRNDSYSPLGKFSGKRNGAPKGHYLEDSMWPWDGSFGQGTDPDPVVKYLQSRPPKRLSEPFNSSDIPDVWPSVPTSPTVADAIDYLGVDGISLGYAYDDTPFGKISNSERTALVTVDSQAIERDKRALITFMDHQLDKTDRLQAVESIKSIQSGVGHDLDKLQSLLSVERDPQLKSHALRLLSNFNQTSKKAMNFAIDSLSDDSISDDFKIYTLRILEDFIHFSPRNTVETKDIKERLKQAAFKSDNLELKRASLMNLATRGDKEALDIISSEKDISMPPQAKLNAYKMLSFPQETIESFSEELIQKSPKQLLFILSKGGISDAESDQVRSLIHSENVPLNVRFSALNAISSRKEFGSLATGIITKNNHEDMFRLEVTTLLLGEVEVRSHVISQYDLDQLSRLVDVKNTPEILKTKINKILEIARQRQREMQKEESQRLDSTPTDSVGEMTGDNRPAPTFEDVKAVLDYCVTENANWRNIRIRHRNPDSGADDPHLFGWETETQLLNAKSRGYWLINPEYRGNGQGAKTNLVQILTNPDGFKGFPRMPYVGKKIDLGSEKVQIIIDWIDSLPQS